MLCIVTSNEVQQELESKSSWVNATSFEFTPCIYHWSFSLYIIYSALNTEWILKELFLQG